MGSWGRSAQRRSVLNDSAGGWLRGVALWGKRHGLSPAADTRGLQGRQGATGAAKLTNTGDVR